MILLSVCLYFQVILFLSVNIHLGKGDESMKLKKLLLMLCAYLAATALLCGCGSAGEEETTEVETDDVFISSQVQ